MITCKNCKQEIYGNPRFIIKLETLTNLGYEKHKFCSKTCLKEFVNKPTLFERMFKKKVKEEKISKEQIHKLVYGALKQVKNDHNKELANDFGFAKRLSGLIYGFINNKNIQ
jgi:hypothetical protein